MNLRQLEVFEAVMRTGSIGQAARALEVSQPAISKSLRLAEEAAGFVLFRRVRGRVFASPEAETLLPLVKRVRGDLDSVSLLIRQLRDGNAGSVTVAAPGSVAHAFITPAIAAFARERPNIRIEVMILPTAMVADRVADAQADFGVVHQPTDNPYLDGEVVCEADGVCVMPRRHALAQRRAVGARELAAERLICYREDTAIGYLVRRALRAARDRRDVDVVINQSQQALDLVEAGAGLAVMDPFLLMAVHRPALVAVPFRPTIPNRLRIIRARERPRSRAAAQFERSILAVIRARTAASPLAGLVRRLSTDGTRIVREGSSPV
ncbi:MAG: LysR family transcriptional regulator [Burkholderiales bacterium]|nr:LysR family transcriptional regulator [Burkholderiales bacterium]